MPFDYQMVTHEEIIKNDFFKWAQYLTFANGKVRVLQKKHTIKKEIFRIWKISFFYACKLGSFKMLMKCAATSSAANVQRNPATVLT